MLYTITLTPKFLTILPPRIEHYQGNSLMLQWFLFRLLAQVNRVFGPTYAVKDDLDSDLVHLFLKSNDSMLMDISIEKTPDESSGELALGL